MSLNFNVIKPDGGGYERPRLRGGFSLLLPLLRYRDNVRPIDSIMELGIAGGGKQILWADMLEGVENGISIGVEIFGPESEHGLSMSKEMFEWHMEGYECSTRQFKDYDNLKAFYGYNSYTKPAHDVVQDYLGDRKLDVIVDDGDPNPVYIHKEKLNISDNWEDLLIHDGIMWSETINGQGTETANEQPFEDRKKVYDQFAEKGWVIFDLAPYSSPNVKEVIGHDNCVFSVWSHDHSQFSDVYSNFEECIISGKQNI